MMKFPKSTRRKFAKYYAALPLAAAVSTANADTPAKAAPFPKSQYEICKVRGHVRKPISIITAELTLDKQNSDEPSKPSTAPGYVEGDLWNTCYYCGMQYRVITRLEEREAPSK